MSTNVKYFTRHGIKIKRPRSVGLRAETRKKTNQRQLYAVDHSARASMKSAASCVN